ncbi:MAG: hypothetical protein IJV00_05365 [Clostridia bacterium]|nr:hypothetical protein [Clostridia bacterium]
MLSNCKASSAFNCALPAGNAVTGTVGVVSDAELLSSSLSLSSLDTDTLYTSGHFASSWTLRSDCYPFPAAASSLASGCGITMKRNSLGDFCPEFDVSFYDGSYSTDWFDDAPASGKVYHLSSAADLAGYVYLVNVVKGGASFGGCTMQLDCNVVWNLGDAADWYESPPTYSWQPISISQAHYSSGGFNGAGHYISGLYQSDNGYNHTGFIGVHGGSDWGVKNLAIVNSYFCKTSTGASQNSNNGVGVFMSTPYNTFTFENLYTDAIVVDASNYTGGIVGTLRSDGATVNIRNCVFAGTIISGGQYVGGIIGGNYSGRVNITDCLNLGNVYGKAYVGGIIGAATSVNTGRYVNIGSCINAGKVSSLDGTTAGAILGRNNADAAQLVPVLSNCKASGAFNTAAPTGNAVSGTVSAIAENTLISRSLTLSSLDTDTLYTTGHFASSWSLNYDCYPFPTTVLSLIRPLGIAPIRNSEGDFSRKAGVSTGGYSTSDPVIYVSSVDDLMELSFVNRFIGASFASQTVRLTDNIVFNTGRASDWGAAPPENVWEPITGFAGTFDGDGHSISGLYVNTSGSAGLFASLAAGGTVRDLALFNSRIINSATSCGGVIGSTGANCRVENVFCEAIIECSSSMAGGIVAVVGNNTVVDGCVFAGSIWAQGRYCGGIVGNTNFNRVTITNCLNLGSVAGADELGGILGICGNTTGDVVANCVNAGYIGSYSNSYNSDISTWTRHNENDLSNGGVVGTIKGSSGVAYRLVYDDCWLVTDFTSNRISVKYTDAVIVGEEKTISLEDVTGIDPALLDGDSVTSDGGTFAANWTQTSAFPLPSGVADMLDGLGVTLSLDADGKPRAYGDMTWYRGFGSVYTLKSASQLESFSKYFASSAVSSKTVYIDCDIDMSASASAPASVWTPLAGFTSSTLEGGGHVLKGLDVAGSLITSSNGAVINALSIVDSTFTSTGTFGTFIGTANGFTTFTDCYTNAVVTGTSNNVGGFVGSLRWVSGGTNTPATEGITFTGCWFDGTVTTNNRYVSGFVANNQSQDCTFTDCLFTGTASSVGHSLEPVIGGFAGAVYGGAGTFVNCVCAGRIVVESNYANSKGGAFSFRSDVPETDTYVNNYAVAGSAHFLSNERNSADRAGECVWISSESLNSLQAVLGGGWGYKNESGTLRLVPAAFADCAYYELSFYKGDRLPENYLVPSLSGKVFAGWYADEALTSPLSPSVTEGAAYAKFADADVMTVRAQWASDENGTYKIRFLSTVDSLDYQNVGFTVFANGSERKVTLTNVYTGILESSVRRDAQYISGCSESRYVSLCNLRKIPADLVNETVTVVPFWTTPDGTLVNGSTFTYGISDNSLRDNTLRVYKLTNFKDHVKVQGRSATVDNGVAVDWSGSALEFRLNCSGDVFVSAIGSYATSLGDGNSNFTVYVDGVQTGTVRVSRGENSDILIASGLSAGVHSFRLTKWAHAESAQVTFTNIKCTGSLLERPADKDVYVEFVGDSITCGYGANNGSNDGNLSYAYIAAQLMDADWSIFARSGLWLTGQTNCIPLLYPYVSWYRDGGVEGGELYDFARVPDVVVINIGTNDYNGNAGAAKFEASVRSFIGDVRSHYGNSVPIVWAYGMMNDGYKDVIISVVDELGGPNYYIGFTQNNDGVNSHPSAAALAQYGSELAAYLNTLLGR